MDYKSSRSDKFRVWLNEMCQTYPMEIEKIEMLMALEKAARLLVHRYNLTGDVENVDANNLARIVANIQESYEKE